MDRRDWLFGLKEIPGIGLVTVQNFLKHMEKHINQGLFPDVSQLSIKDLRSFGIPEDKARAIKQTMTEDFIAERYERYRKAGVQVIVDGDEAYPPLLREIYQRPYVFYVKGDIEKLKHPSIAVVGTRRATPYGKRAARRLVSELCAAGLGIVSGMARGIDTEAHRTSLAEGAPSAAVLGTGLDIIYPRENALLIDRMAQEGVLVSEWPLGTPASKGLFHLRNRIISGLTLGTLVVEAGMKSGALITAEYAVEQDRDVYFVPGSIFSEQSQGTLAEIKNFPSQCVTSGVEIAEKYTHIISRLRPSSRKPSARVKLTEDERRVLEIIAEKERSIDEILELTQYQFGHLHTVLLSLLIKKQIQKTPGSTYVSIY
ncbi:DNA processing protein DprA [Insulibacter thermoxylanivorax]|uniref:DNA processing protein DprA n=1 Tax=Insulibacter thermoxylanivorax TaxID=2749268 RepID=A0A916VFK0_9BACL|nr:DNA-processing protein DprA [Insulibacter thermoxylanivorax]GFR37744.1 DNA processing protein DprA [Insulibacter thermoxylanivorax]